MTGEALTRWKYQRYMRDYLATVQSVDDGIGRILDLLDKRGLAKNTIVVYTSDQGFFLGDHGLYDKHFMYEESLRMPFLVRWPGAIKPRARIDAMALNVDFAPTFLTMAGAEIPKEMQGRPMLAAKGQPQPERRKYVFSARDRMDETLDRIRAVRDDRYRLVRNFHPELPYAQRIQYGEQMPTMTLE